MAKCASLQQIFETPLPPNPTLIKSLTSWRHQIKSIPPDLSSFTELFGELHHPIHSEQHDHRHDNEEKDDVPSCICSEENDNEDVKNAEERIKNETKLSRPPNDSSFTELFGELCFCDPCPLPLSPFIPVNTQTRFKTFNDDNNAYNNIKPARTTSASSDGINMQLCTEGLGFESFDVEGNDNVDGDHPNEEDIRASVRRQSYMEEQSELRRLRRLKSYPPPISSIGGNGKPWLYFRSFRRDGRFILRQCKIRTHVFFNAYREDGCLRLHPVRPAKQRIENEDANIRDKENSDNVHESKGYAENDKEKMVLKLANMN
ncbi:hypothetical protein ACHQM5_021144 [Ranunculus cassubicifolius]